MKNRLLIASISLLLSCGSTVNKGVARPACKDRLPYQGAPAYSANVAMPRINLAKANFPANTARALETAFAEAMRHTRAQSMTASVISAQGRWSRTKSADGSTPPVKFWWASVGKAFTATIILQLADEGKIALSDRVSRWNFSFPGAELMTVDDLLMHTGGLYSANEDEDARCDARYRNPRENIEIAAQHGLLFCPGQAWRYSNTGYDVLGLIIEATEQKPYHQVVADRIAKKLGAKSLRALTPNEPASDVAPLRQAVEGHRVHPSWIFAAGSVVASAEDMAVFWHGLLTGRLLTAKSTALMAERFYPMFDQGTFYGRGLMLYTFPEKGNQVLLGHSGGAPGAKAAALYYTRDETFVAVALTGNGSAEASAHLLIKTVRENSSQGGKANE
jgi:D-alanyl-D-alanine carboxypeptidase